MDLIIYQLLVMMCCPDWLGTDYAHPERHIEEVIRYVRDMGLSKEDTDKIF